jgi:hypothetical protein
VADDHIDNLLTVLEASFDAGVARGEDEAASDLALSLLQDARLPAALERDGAVAVLLLGGARAPVTEVGEDYVACHFGMEIVVPLAHATLVADAGRERPSVSDLSFLGKLRALVRRGAIVEVHTVRGAHRGRLGAATPDHLVIVRAGGGATRAGTFYVSLRAVIEVSVLDGAP